MKKIYKATRLRFGTSIVVSECTAAFLVGVDCICSLNCLASVDSDKAVVLAFPPINIYNNVNYFSTICSVNILTCDSHSY